MNDNQQIMQIQKIKLLKIINDHVIKDNITLNMLSDFTGLDVRTLSSLLKGKASSISRIENIARSIEGCFFNREDIFYESNIEFFKVDSTQLVPCIDTERRISFNTSILLTYYRELPRHIAIRFLVVHLFPHEIMCCYVSDGIRFLYPHYPYKSVVISDATYLNNKEGCMKLVNSLMLDQGKLIIDDNGLCVYEKHDGVWMEKNTKLLDDWLIARHRVRKD